MDVGYKLPDIRAITIGQWFGVLQKDGPGSEQETVHRDPRSFAEMVNAARVKKGLPPLEIPSEPNQGDDMAKDSELKPGVRVATPHGAGEVVEQNRDAGGWMVKVGDGAPVFFHAWNLTVVPPLPKSDS